MNAAQRIVGQVQESQFWKVGELPWDEYGQVVVTYVQLMQVVEPGEHLTIQDANIAISHTYLTNIAQSSSHKLVGIQSQGVFVQNDSLNIISSQGQTGNVLLLAVQGVLALNPVTVTR